MHDSWTYALWIIGAFLLGSISVGDIVARTAGVNIRKLGNGNPGAANIYREIGPAHGVAVIVLDLIKGAAATLPIYFLDFPVLIRILSMGTLITGHLFPVFWMFRGGTGMATSMGCSFGLLPLGGLIALPATLLAIVFSRNPGYSGALFFLILVTAGGFLHNDWVSVLGICLATGAIFIKSRIQYRQPDQT